MRSRGRILPHASHFSRPSRFEQHYPEVAEAMAAQGKPLPACLEREYEVYVVKTYRTEGIRILGSIWLIGFANQATFRW